MTTQEIISQLESWGSESYKRILINHGAKEPVLGVKIADLKKLQKQFMGEYELALELFDTGIYDAQYLAGLITDDSRMTKRDLQRWLKTSNCAAISSSVVSWVAAESAHGWELAQKWIESPKEMTAQAGWTTLCALVAITEDSNLDVKTLKRLLQQVGKSIQKAPNFVRYGMNSFVIAVGCYVADLTDEAIKTAKSVGTVSVDMGNTACEVPAAAEYIAKVQKRGSIGKKRKTAKC
ncbi:MAG: DNA alkylation repair protein [Planctomycetaceae bacterium]|nr:DNA alkylation repair protein [Planctomycetaceae bacterium]MCA9044271.1 DNA alkylation repair protein [Planctomycetaceae bacterium]MCB9949693.1 DNA alkylation repair protein [Planctomycetaceae bacterium]